MKHHTDNPVIRARHFARRVAKLKCPGNHHPERSKVYQKTFSQVLSELCGWTDPSLTPEFAQDMTPQHPESRQPGH